MNLVYRALSDPTRRKILELLRDGDKTAGELGQAFTHTAPTMSRHFNVLKNADLVQGDKTGTSITYRLNVSLLEEAMLTLLNQFQLDVSGSPKEQKNE